MNICRNFFLFIIYLVFTVSSVPLKEINEEKQSYIVIIKSTTFNNSISSIIQDDDLYQSHLSWITLSQQTYNNEIIHEFAIGDNFRGYVGLFEPKFVDEILSKRNDVELIAPDSEVQVSYDLREDNANSDDFSSLGTKKQENPTWVSFNYFFFFLFFVIK